MLAFRELLGSGSLGDAEAVAYALHMLSEAVQPNVLEYFSAKATRLCACLGGVLDRSSNAALFAAVCAVKNLAATPYNRCDTLPIFFDLKSLHTHLHAPTPEHS